MPLEKYYRALRCASTGSLLLVLSHPVNAQEPIGTVPPPTAAPSTPPPAPAPVNRSLPDSFYSSSGATGTSALVHEQAEAFWGADPFEAFLTNPLQWGPFQLRPFASYRYLYGNGLGSRRDNDTYTSLHQISPGAILVSRHLAFRYTPTLNYYSSEAFEDNVAHSASANANYGIGDWFLSLGHSFSKTQSPLVETGAQTSQQRHGTILSALYRYSDKTSFQFSLSQTIQETERLNNSKSWSLMNWVNYHLSEKTLIGAGVGGGYTQQEFGSDMTHEQIQGRIGWMPSEKVSFSLNGGVEFRQFVDSTFDDQVNPIGGASINYSPWEATSFSLSANHGVGSSLLRAQTSVRSRVSAGYRQRLLGTLYLGVFGSLGTTEYEGVQDAENPDSTRTDEIASFSANLGVGFLKRGDFSVFYQRSKNDSTDENLSFTSNQYGFQVAYHF